jgi:hypothetical protein
VNEIIPSLFVGTREDAAALGATVPISWECISVTEYRAIYGRNEECPNEPVGSIDLPFMKTGTADPAILNAIAETIAAALDAGKRVLVHCVHAHERSPLAIVWYLVWSGQATSLESAYEHMTRKHPSTELRLKWLRGSIPQVHADVPTPLELS